MTHLGDGVRAGEVGGGGADDGGDGGGGGEGGGALHEGDGLRRGGRGGVAGRRRANRDGGTDSADEERHDDEEAYPRGGTRVETRDTKRRERGRAARRAKSARAKRVASRCGGETQTEVHKDQGDVSSSNIGELDQVEDIIPGDEIRHTTGIAVLPGKDSNYECTGERESHFYGTSSSSSAAKTWDRATRA